MKRAFFSLVPEYIKSNLFLPFSMLFSSGSLNNNNTRFHTQEFSPREYN